jgi:hypothetical protein
MSLCVYTRVLVFAMIGRQWMDGCPTELERDQYIACTNTGAPDGEI